MKAFSDGWSSSIRRRQASVISSAVTSRVRSLRANSSIVTLGTKKRGGSYDPPQYAGRPEGPPLRPLEREVEPELQNARLEGRRLVERRQSERRRIAERRRVRPIVGVVEDIEHLRHQVGVATAAKREALLQPHVHAVDRLANQLRTIEEELTVEHLALDRADPVTHVRIKLRG